MSATGISPAWVQNIKFGEPLVFSPEVIHAIFASCEIQFIGDASVEHPFSLVCTIDDGNINAFIDLALSCVAATIGDVTKTIDLDVSCVATTIGDVSKTINLALFCSVVTSGP